MNRTKCAIWHLTGEDPEPPEENAYTETTDGQTLLAVAGKDALGVMERVTTVDLGVPSLTPPVLSGAPWCHPLPGRPLFPGRP